MIELKNRRHALLAGSLVAVGVLGAGCFVEQPANPGGGEPAPTTVPAPTTEPAPTTAAPGAETIEVTNATLSWAISPYAQYGAIGAWRIFPQGDDVVVTQVPATEIDPTDTTANKLYNVINWTGGEGEIDPETGAGQITWNSSDVVINSYPAFANAPDETFGAPVLTVNPDGSGELSVLYSVPAHQDQAGNPFPAVEAERVAIATFDSLDELTASGLSAAPAFDGREYLVGGVNQVVPCAAPNRSGAFPQEFIDFVPASLKAHFYTTSCGTTQNRKAPSQFQVAFGVPAAR